MIKFESKKQEIAFWLSMLFVALVIIISFSSFAHAGIETLNDTALVNVTVFKSGSQLVLVFSNQTQIYNASEDFTSTFVFNFTYTYAANITIEQNTTNLSFFSQNYYINDTQAAEVSDKCTTAISNLFKGFQDDYIKGCRDERDSYKEKLQACNFSVIEAQLNFSELRTKINLKEEQISSCNTNRSLLLIVTSFILALLTIIIVFASSTSPINIIRRLKMRRPSPTD